MEKCSYPLICTFHTAALLTRTGAEIPTRRHEKEQMTSNGVRPIVKLNGRFTNPSTSQTSDSSKERKGENGRQILARQLFDCVKVNNIWTTYCVL